MDAETLLQGLFVVPREKRKKERRRRTTTRRKFNRIVHCLMSFFFLINKEGIQTVTCQEKYNTIILY